MVLLADPGRRASASSPASRLLLTLPIAISVVLVSVFTRAGTTVLFAIGPFDATVEGVDFAAQTLVRLFAISLSIGLFVLTTHPRAFVFDLERRGVSPRVAFVAVATIEAVPALVERASIIGESQRARGLDTEGGVRARLRGVLPLVGPVIIGALTDVEERSLALESRAFSRPGRRHLLWAMPDRDLGARGSAGPCWRCSWRPPSARIAGLDLTSRCCSSTASPTATPATPAGPPRHRPDPRATARSSGVVGANEVGQVDAVPRRLGPRPGVDRRRPDAVG